MATTLLTENIYSCCNIDITVNGSNYSDVKLRVLKKLVYRYLTRTRLSVTI